MDVTIGCHGRPSAPPLSGGSHAYPKRATQLRYRKRRRSAAIVCWIIARASIRLAFIQSPSRSPLPLWFIAVTLVSFARGPQVELEPRLRHLVLHLFLPAVPVHSVSCSERLAPTLAQDELPRVPRKRGRHRYRTDARPRGPARDSGDSCLAHLRSDPDRCDLDRRATRRPELISVQP